MAGVFAAGRVRAVLSVAVGLWVAGIAAAQPGAVAPPPPRTLLPVQAQETPPELRRPYPPSTPALLSPDPALPPPPPPGVTLTRPAFADPPMPPLPGSVEDQYQQELAARRLFTADAWWGATFTALPNTLLWEPPLAVKREPRMQALYTNQRNFRTADSLDTSIGMTMGLLRVEPDGADFAAQLDIFGVAITRLSPEDVTLDDYRFGFPVTFKWGWWQGKVGYEHTSAHLGDRLIRATPGLPINNFAKDEVVASLGRFLYDNLRVYGQAGYAFGFHVPTVSPTTRDRFRFDLGAEWFLRCPTGWQGTPYAAADVEWRGDERYVPNYTLQAGWFWRNPTMRLGTLRVFVEHYRGQSPYGQFIATREKFTGVGFGFDY